MSEEQTKSSSKPRSVLDFSWLDRDYWVRNKVKNLKDFKSYLINRGVPTCASQYAGVWHGEIKQCPSCNETRVTSCCACGCGSCYTCGKMWVCNSDSIEPPLNNPQYTKFGKLMWNLIRDLGEEFCWDEWSEDVLPLAQQAGLCCRVEYNPEVHGMIEAAEPGDEIWWWGGGVADNNIKHNTNDTAAPLSLAEQCFALENIEDDLFEEINQILECNTNNCLQDEFLWGALDVSWDSYDSSVEVIRPSNAQWMTREQANKILDLGFSIVFETLDGKEGRAWTRSGCSKCSKYPCDPEPEKGLKVEIKKLRGKLREYDSHFFTTW